MQPTSKMAMYGKGGSRGYGDVPPNQTLYVNNLNEKITIAELKCCLLELFSTHGEVIEIIASNAQRKKAQAFVVFRDISCATNALRSLQNFAFLDKPMRIQYSKTKSDVVAHEDGTYRPRHKGDDKAEKEAKKPAMPSLRQKGLAPPAAAKGKGKGEEAGKGKDAPKMTPPPAGPGAAAVGGGGGDDEAGGNPSNVLFVENLPAEVNEMMLTMLFRQYPGFQEARLIKGRNVAFIEYADELQAGIAKHGLQGFMVTPEMSLKIAFAKQ